MFIPNQEWVKISFLQDSGLLYSPVCSRNRPLSHLVFLTVCQEPEANHIILEICLEQPEGNFSDVSRGSPRLKEVVSVVRY